MINLYEVQETNKMIEESIWMCGRSQWESAF